MALYLLPALHCNAFHAESEASRLRKPRPRKWRHQRHSHNKYRRSGVAVAKKSSYAQVFHSACIHICMLSSHCATRMYSFKCKSAFAQFSPFHKRPKKVARDKVPRAGVTMIVLERKKGRAASFTGGACMQIKRAEDEKARLQVISNARLRCSRCLW